VCLPEHEGGLGIKRISKWNTAAMMKHVWDIVSNKDSLVTWCNNELIKGGNFWTIPHGYSSSWTWRKLLNFRETMMNLVVYRIGNGQHISLRHEPWLNNTPLASIYGWRLAYDSGIPLWATVSTVLRYDHWNWPGTMWQLQEISSAEESISHLFFACKFTKEIWENIQTLCDCKRSADNWDFESLWIINHAKGKEFYKWLRRIAMAATIYHCWIGRNRRIYQNSFLNTARIIAMI
ncbi:LOW QUALITY PROTEIN: hypothetical protein CFOL_v3_33394, partial [Cephalotus follicularis]